MHIGGLETIEGLEGEEVDVNLRENINWTAHLGDPLTGAMDVASSARWRLDAVGVYTASNAVPYTLSGSLAQWRFSLRFRRVTTHKDQNGTSVFMADEWLEPLTLSFLPDVEFFRLVSGAGPPRVGSGAVLPEPTAFFPDAGGYSFVISTIPPGLVRSPERMDKHAALAEAEEKLPGLLSASEREPGMHTSRSLDLVVILAGQVILELDDGASVDLNAGDLVVQIGARHRWHNRGSERAVILSGVIGGTVEED